MVEVDVAHAADDELLAFYALFDLAGRVFFADAQQGVHQLFFVALLFRNHRYRMKRIGETDLIVYDGRFGQREGIASTGVLQLRQYDDISGDGFRNGNLFLADQGKELA